MTDDAGLYGTYTLSQVPGHHESLLSRTGRADHSGYSQK